MKALHQQGQCTMPETSEASQKQAVGIMVLVVKRMNVMVMMEMVMVMERGGVD